MKKLTLIGLLIFVATNMLVFSVTSANCLTVTTENIDQRASLSNNEIDTPMVSYGGPGDQPCGPGSGGGQGPGQRTG